MDRKMTSLIFQLGCHKVNIQIWEGFLFSDLLLYTPEFAKTKTSVSNHKEISAPSSRK